MTRRQAFIGVLAAALAVATACGSSGSGANATDVDFSAKPAGTLNAWAFDNADDVGKARMAYAASQLPGVNIAYDQTGFNAQKFTTRLTSGNVPDVVQMERQYVPTYAAQGLIMPLDKCYSQHNVDPRSRFYPAVVGDVAYRGQVWAVPQFFQPPAIIVDTSVLKQAGVDKSEIDTSKPDVLLGAIKKMYQANGGVPTRLGFDAQWTGQATLWILGLGGHLSDKDGKPTLDDPANLYPLQLLKQIADAQGGYAKIKSLVDSFDTFGGHNQFVKHQVGAQINAQWYPNVLSEYQDKVSIEAVPFRARDGKPATVTGGSAFAIPAKAKNPAAACAWALALSTEDNWLAAGAARAKTIEGKHGINTGLFTGSPAADKSVRAKFVEPSGNAGFDQTVSTYYDVLTAGVPLGASPAGQDIKNDLSSAVTATMLGQKSPQQALADAQQAALRAYNTITR
jgi:multiple sugar transport system substrate-binding protein